MNRFRDAMNLLRQARAHSQEAFTRFMGSLFELRRREAASIENPAHRVLHAIGVNYGVDPHWPRKPGARERGKLRRISRFSRRLNLRRSR